MSEESNSKGRKGSPTTTGAEDEPTHQVDRDALRAALRARKAQAQQSDSSSSPDATEQLDRGDVREAIARRHARTTGGDADQATSRVDRDALRSALRARQQSSTEEASTEMLDSGAVPITAFEPFDDGIDADSATSMLDSGAVPITAFEPVDDGIDADSATSMLDPASISIPALDLEDDATTNEGSISHARRIRDRLRGGRPSAPSGPAQVPEDDATATAEARSVDMARQIRDRARQRGAESNVPEHTVPSRSTLEREALDVAESLRNDGDARARQPLSGSMPVVEMDEATNEAPLVARPGRTDSGSHRPASGAVPAAAKQSGAHDELRPDSVVAGPPASEDPTGTKELADIIAAWGGAYGSPEKDPTISPEQSLDRAMERFHLSRHGGTSQHTLDLTSEGSLPEIQEAIARRKAELDAKRPPRKLVVFAGALAVSLLVSAGLVAAAFAGWWPPVRMGIALAAWAIPAIVAGFVLFRQDIARGILLALGVLVGSAPPAAWFAPQVRTVVLEQAVDRDMDLPVAALFTDESTAVVDTACSTLTAKQLVPEAIPALVADPELAVRCWEKTVYVDSGRALENAVTARWREDLVTAPDCSGRDLQIAAFVRMQEKDETTRSVLDTALAASSQEVRVCVANELLGSLGEQGFVSSLGDVKTRTVHDNELFPLSVRYAFASADDPVRQTLSLGSPEFFQWTVALGCALTAEQPSNRAVVEDLNVLAAAATSSVGFIAQRSAWLQWCEDLPEDASSRDVAKLVAGDRIRSAFRTAGVIVERAINARDRQLTDSGIRAGAATMSDQRYDLFGREGLPGSGGKSLPIHTPELALLQGEFAVANAEAAELWGDDGPGALGEGQSAEPKKSKECEKYRRQLYGGVFPEQVEFLRQFDQDQANELQGIGQATRAQRSEEQDEVLTENVRKSCGKKTLEEYEAYKAKVEADAS